MESGVRYPFGLGGGLVEVYIPMVGLVNEEKGVYKTWISQDGKYDGDWIFSSVVCMLILRYSCNV